ncbi:hypothetical protein [Lactobacillus sp. ESL0228]|uniref:hypothetical protein n=1 Tax=Lactobacillus sp. ESL0228 TaxID=2069352 RepID=UPI000EFC1760|nr:hypothetical protein [Lactobacillus sp. ESL0228]RMC49111.1 hypothetical protein F5ESL0228_05870 [Lactobacillus sp. ESL0228]
MRYLLELNQKQEYGQIPVADQNGKICYIIQGNLDNPNHTLYLKRTNGKEIGRLYSDGNGLISSFTIDVVNHSLVKVKRLNSRLTNLFYITRLNYLVSGSIKNGSYKFLSGLKKIAIVKTDMNKLGVILTCDILRPEDVPFILLCATLFTQWHTTPLRLPTFPPIGQKYNVKFN